MSWNPKNAKKLVFFHVFIMFLSSVLSFFIIFPESLDFAECSSIFLIFCSNMLQNTRNPWKKQQNPRILETWLKNEKMIKQWKINREWKKHKNQNEKNMKK